MRDSTFCAMLCGAFLFFLKRTRLYTIAGYMSSVQWFLVLKTFRNVHWFIRQMPKIFQNYSRFTTSQRSMTSLPLGIIMPRYALCGTAMITTSLSFTSSSFVTKSGFFAYSSE